MALRSRYGHEFARKLVSGCSPPSPRQPLLFGLARRCIEDGQGIECRPTRAIASSVERGRWREVTSASSLAAQLPVLVSSAMSTGFQPSGGPNRHTWIGNAYLASQTTSRSGGIDGAAGGGSVENASSASGYVSVSQTNRCARRPQPRAPASGTSSRPARLRARSAYPGC